MSDLTHYRDYCRAQAARDPELAAEWTRQADEIDAYLADDTDVDLFGDVSKIPEVES